MIWIKRIASTPAPSGRIIDSFETGDDKSTNAPSIRATLEKLNLKAEIDDSTYASDKTLSGAKIKQMFDSVDGVALDDTAPSTNTVYSSSKTENFVNTSLAQLKELLYPVGKIVLETSISTEADMITHYGGTSWELLTDAFLVGAGGNYNVNASGGYDTVKLSADNLPKHTHAYVNTIVGSTKLTLNQIPKHQHYNASTPDKTLVVGGNTDIYGYSGIGATTSPGIQWGKGVYPEGGSGTHTHGDVTQNKTTGETGSGTAFSILPPYIAVYMWRRIA